MGHFGEIVKGPAAGVLLASGFGHSGGGVFAHEGAAFRQIDRVSTQGLAFDGLRLARSLRCSVEDAHMAELVIYDARGVERYQRSMGLAIATTLRGMERTSLPFRRGKCRAMGFSGGQDRSRGSLPRRG